MGVAIFIRGCSVCALLIFQHLQPVLTVHEEWGRARSTLFHSLDGLNICSQSQPRGIKRQDACALNCQCTRMFLQHLIGLQVMSLFYCLAKQSELTMIQRACKRSKPENKKVATVRGLLALQMDCDNNCCNIFLNDLSRKM